MGDVSQAEALPQQNAHGPMAGARSPRSGSSTAISEPARSTLSSRHRGCGDDPCAVGGVVSLILWSLILIVFFKYAILILRADNHGEGGIMALLALLDARHAPAGSWRASLLIFGLIGAVLLYGDGVITPAISVLSAVEGVKLDAPQLAPAVVPISIAILVGLFLVQRKGTQYIGNIFGPVMVVWFVVISLLGLRGIIMAPGIITAVKSSLCALSYLTNVEPHIAFGVPDRVSRRHRSRGDVCGYGPFRPRAHPPGWFAVVLPALMLNYFGQGGAPVSKPEALEIRSICWLQGGRIIPLSGWRRATIIASQAVISGAFSLTQQSIQLGFLPRMRVFIRPVMKKGRFTFHWRTGFLPRARSARCFISARRTPLAALTASPCPC